MFSSLILVAAPVACAMRLVSREANTHFSWIICSHTMGLQPLGNNVNLVIHRAATCPRHPVARHPHRNGQRSRSFFKHVIPEAHRVTCAIGALKLMHRQATGPGPWLHDLSHILDAGWVFAVIPNVGKQGRVNVPDLALGCEYAEGG